MSLPKNLSSKQQGKKTKKNEQTTSSFHDAIWKKLQPEIRKIPILKKILPPLKATPQPKKFPYNINPVLQYSFLASFFVINQLLGNPLMKFFNFMHDLLFSKEKLPDQNALDEAVFYIHNTGNNKEEKGEKIQKAVKLKLISFINYILKLKKLKSSR